MKDVLVKVKTVQSDENRENDTIELTAEGKFASKDGAYLIKYSDALYRAQMTLFSPQLRLHLTAVFR